MAKINVGLLFFVILSIVKGQNENPENGNSVTPASTASSPANDSDTKTTPSTPVMFENIMSTLAERLNVTMEKPYLQGERDRIMESTRQGLTECEEGYKWTNVRSRYRLCIDKQVQAALIRANMFEMQRLPQYLGGTMSGSRISKDGPRARGMLFGSDSRTPDIVPTPQLAGRAHEVHDPRERFPAPKQVNPTALPEYSQLAGRAHEVQDPRRVLLHRNENNPGMLLGGQLAGRAHEIQDPREMHLTSRQQYPGMLPISQLAGRAHEVQDPRHISPTVRENNFYVPTSQLSGRAHEVQDPRGARHVSQREYPGMLPTSKLPEHAFEDQNPKVEFFIPEIRGISLN